MWQLDYKESWAQKNWCFWSVVLEQTLESPLDCKEIQLVHPKGDQSWVFIGRTDAEAETPILWPPNVKSWLIWKDPDVGKDWGQEKGTTEDEMVGWHHLLDGHGFGWTPGIGDGQGGLVCCSSWGRKESDTTERLNRTNWTEKFYEAVSLCGSIFIHQGYFNLKTHDLHFGGNFLTILNILFPSFSLPFRMPPIQLFICWTSPIIFKYSFSYFNLCCSALLSGSFLQLYLQHGYWIFPAVIFLFPESSLLFWFFLLKKCHSSCLWVLLTLGILTIVFLFCFVFFIKSLFFSFVANTWYALLHILSAYS